MDGDEKRTFSKDPATSHGSSVKFKALAQAEIYKLRENLKKDQKIIIFNKNRRFELVLCLFF